MTEDTTIECPDCVTALVTTAMQPMQPIRCAACGATFVLGAVGQPIRTSGKARASLILGIASLLCMMFTGIPAVVLGLLALRDIRRQPGTLLGRGLALTGIISGTVVGLGVSLIAVGATGLGIWISKSIERTDEAARVQEIAAIMGEFDLPPDMKPRNAIRALGMTAVDFIHASEQGGDRLRVYLVHYSDRMLADRRQVRAQLVYHEGRLGGSKVESSHQWICNVGGETVEVDEEIRSGQDGAIYRNYIAVLPARDGNVLAIVAVKQPPASDTAPLMTKHMVRRFYESFEAPE